MNGSLAKRSPEAASGTLSSSTAAAKGFDFAAPTMNLTRFQPAHDAGWAIASLM
jgi:hypothetical protein